MARRSTTCTTSPRHAQSATDSNQNIAWQPHTSRLNLVRQRTVTQTCVSQVILRRRERLEPQRLPRLRPPRWAATSARSAGMQGSARYYNPHGRFISETDRVRRKRNQFVSYAADNPITIWIKRPCESESFQPLNRPNTIRYANNWNPSGYYSVAGHGDITERDSLVRSQTNTNSWHS